MDRQSLVNLQLKEPIDDTIKDDLGVVYVDGSPDVGTVRILARLHVECGTRVMVGDPLLKLGDRPRDSFVERLHLR